jgi:hypothetical protein
VKVNHLLALLE